LKSALDLVHTTRMDTVWQQVCDRTTDHVNYDVIFRLTDDGGNMVGHRVLHQQLLPQWEEINKSFPTTNNNANGH